MIEERILSLDGSRHVRYGEVVDPKAVVLTLETSKDERCEAAYAFA